MSTGTWMNQAHLLLIGYALLASVFIINENRRPQATFAWMLLFFALPGVGIVIYLIFGRNRRVFSRQRKLVQQEVPGRLGELLEELGQQHEQALEEMERQAHDLGGNAVLSVDLDYETIQVGSGGGMLMVSASGTAVVLG